MVTYTSHHKLHSSFLSTACNQRLIYSTYRLFAVVQLPSWEENNYCEVSAKAGEFFADTMWRVYNETSISCHWAIHLMIVHPVCMKDN